MEVLPQVSRLYPEGEQERKQLEHNSEVEVPRPYLGLPSHATEDGPCVFSRTRSPVDTIPCKIITYRFFS